MKVLSNLFGYLLNWLYIWCGNYGFAIIIFSVFLRLILLPITIKQQKSMEKSAEMQEKLKIVQKKYKGDPELLNKETIALYKQEKVSPFSGCLSAIIQIIIILSVFYLVSKPLTYMKKIDSSIIDNYISEIKEEDGTISTYSEIAVIQKRGSENPDVYINMNFLGLDLSKVPNQNITDYTVYIIPALYVITSFISIKLTTNMQNKKPKKKLEKNKEDITNVEEVKDEKDETLESMQEMNKSMTYMMPIMSIFIAFVAPLGLALYWLVSNILMIFERLILDRINKKSESEKEL